MSDMGVERWPNQPDIEQVRSLLNAIYETYGFDFRDYSDISMTRRIQTSMRAESIASIPEFERRLSADRACMERFLNSVTVNVTSMFRDPDFYLALRNKVIPRIRDNRFLRIWHAGCSTGEEVLSLAIVLREEGLSARCRIYATDVNAEVLDQAKQGVFPLQSLREYSRNYIAAGGTQSFSNYYVARYDRAIFDRTLSSDIVFSQHNLVSDGPFNRFDIILCRNVIIYFNQALADQVHHLLHESLMPAGFLCLGNRETIQFTRHESQFQNIHADHAIYQKLE